MSLGKGNKPEIARKLAKQRLLLLFVLATDSHLLSCQGGFGFCFFLKWLFAKGNKILKFMRHMAQKTHEAMVACAIIFLWAVA